MITKINHVGIVVKSIDEAAKLYTDVLGLKVKEIEVVTEQKVKTAIISVGESNIELMEPIGSEGPIAKYLEKRGEGMHHLALEVNDIEDALETMVNNGIPLIDEKPRMGVGGNRIAFLHPKATKVLIELVEPSRR
jgi:lactoylglutathione lyase/methylmalonyl-CoA/ethylmalonyl-CoA epimerase